MILSIEDAILAIKNSDYSKAKILEKREGVLGGEHVFGFYVTNNKQLPEGSNDPFGYGLLVSEKGDVDCLSDIVSMSLLDILDIVK